jgi:carboxymethylenebutenolidase
MMVQIETNDGPMHAYVARPRNVAAVSRGAIVFQEAYGVNEHIRDVADRIAELGFVAVAPQLFHRTAPPEWDAPYDTEGTWERIEPHYDAITEATLAQDAQRSYEWLVREGGVDTVSAIGFCMGGRAAYVANAYVDLECAVSFYGGGIAPALLPLAQRQHGPMLMFWGGLDANIKPENYRAVADALTAADTVHEQVVFSQAGHGFFCDRRKSYHREAALQAWALTSAFFETQCGSSS